MFGVDIEHSPPCCSSLFAVARLVHYCSYLESSINVVWVVISSVFKVLLGIVYSAEVEV